MSKLQQYLESTSNCIFVLFSEKDFNNFKKDYEDEFIDAGVNMNHVFDKKTNKVRVKLYGNTSYLFNKYFTEDIEKNYNGAIA